MEEICKKACLTATAFNPTFHKKESLQYGNKMSQNEDKVQLPKLDHRSFCCQL